MDYRSEMSQRRDLNPWPLPYQGSALPLSYVGLIDQSDIARQTLATSAHLIKRAGDEARTRDLQLGRLSLYQLSYTRLY